jgi:hypothetical protein
MLELKRIKTALLVCACLGLTAWAAGAHAGAREEGRLLVATEVVEEVQGMPDQRIPDTLLSRAYGIAVIPAGVMATACSSCATSSPRPGATRCSFL